MLSRRAFLGTAGGVAAGVGLTACSDTWGEMATAKQPTDPSIETFYSRPDLVPARVLVSANTVDTAPGMFFVDSHGGVGQQGPMIIDGNGNLVWFKPLSDNADPSKRAFTVRAQTYQGKPVLTWFEGAVVAAHGEGEYVIADTSYREIKRVRAGNGHVGDLHEFVITEQDTAWFICYGTERRRRPRDPYFYGVVQEVDIATGEVLFEWRSDDHVPVEDSYKPRGGPDPYDYIHLNSIAFDTDGNLIVSARNTWCVYKIDRTTGDVLWRMGGKHSDFDVEVNARFAWQHHAVPRGDGVLTLFDNEAAPANADQSRGLVLAVDEQARTVRLTAEYLHPVTPILAGALGSMETLSDGRVLVGYCQPAVFTEFAADGTVLFDAALAGDETKTYRVFKQEWSATPAEPPAVNVRQQSGRTLVDVSWNGATEVRAWRVVGDGRRLATSDTQGFETTIELPDRPASVTVEALDLDGKVIGTAKA